MVVWLKVSNPKVGIIFCAVVRMLSELDKYQAAA
jgi:hypothetical protein